MVAVAEMSCDCQTCSVRRTLARYNLAGDTGRVSDLAATFTTSGVLETANWRAVGRAEITTRLHSVIDECDIRLTTARHHLTTSFIETEADDVVRVRSYFMVVTDIGLDHTGSYFDRLIRVDSEWLFAERSTRLHWIAPNSLFNLRRSPDEERPASPDRLTHAD